MKDTLSVSIIVPVYHDWGSLQRCLDALGQQSYPEEYFEVLVVQNDQTGMPLGLRAPPNTIFLQEKKTGSYAARNAGLRRAGGEIIGFTDADCIPRADWIERALRWFDGAPSVSRLAGRIDVITRAPPRRTVAEVYELLFEFPQEITVNRQQSSATANLFVRRAAIELVGGFDERYFSGGDIEWGQRAQRAGLRILYADDVVVGHPARKSYRALLRKARRVGAGKFTHSQYEFFWAHIGMVKALVPSVRMFFRSLKYDVAYLENITAMAIHYHLKLVKAFSRLQVAYGKRAPRV